MSNWSKGSQVEKARRKKLESEGWLVRTWPKVVFGEQDLWGFDLIAIKTGHVRMEQVKSKKDSMPSVDRQTIEAMQGAWSHSCEHVTLWWIGCNRATKEWREVLIDDPFNYEKYLLKKRKKA